MLVLASPIFQACAPSNQTSKPSNRDRQSKSVVSTDKYKLTLAGYLQRVPGVMVRGQNTDIMVFIRGVSSMRSGNKPLFVIDGHQLGNSYSDANRLVDMSDVQKIEVLNSLECNSMFGLRGNNGVILITTKK